MVGNNFGFNSRSNNKGIENSVQEGLVYEQYVDQFVRIGIAGGIGGTGVLREVDRYSRDGHALHLTPYIFYDPDHTPRICNETMMILALHSNASVIPIPDTMEDYISKVLAENTLRRKSLTEKTEEKE